MLVLWWFLVVVLVLWKLWIRVCMLVRCCWLVWILSCCMSRLVIIIRIFCCVFVIFLCVRLCLWRIWMWWLWCWVVLVCLMNCLKCLCWFRWKNCVLCWLFLLVVNFGRGCCSGFVINWFWWVWLIWKIWIWCRWLMILIRCLMWCLCFMRIVVRKKVWMRRIICCVWKKIGCFICNWLVMIVGWVLVVVFFI